MCVQRDATKESQILMWIWNVLEEIGTFDFEQYLRDGVLLCRLMNTIKPGSIPGDISAGSNLAVKRKNVEKFLAACEKYGVPKALLFHPEDLLLMQHLPRVTRCIFALGKLVEENGDWDGPQLGDEPYEAVNKAGRRRGGMPFGDDIYVAHVNIENVKKTLATPDPKRQVKPKKISLIDLGHW
ncbi:hypothetical protein LAZ67_2002893 [Cordylochernes scorpioides]|uniref:Calponin-homology (CH) domain-containing protein n=1 Tax=Cordylochernes scorpioides TaxID=51811 RepID=A0ABY6K2K5_9ARAC|nr:hypothetical protein LAZ67_2002893 [Cordylochernes scorpioides]